MIIHVHTSGFERRTPDFIKFIQTNFNSNSHYFWLTGDLPSTVSTPQNTHSLSQNSSLRIASWKNFIIQANQADKIIIHGLFDFWIIAAFALMPWLSNKIYWVLWGGDYFTYQFGRRTMKWRLKEFFKRQLIHRIGHLITYIEGSVRLAREWYGATGIYHECLAYPNHIPELPTAQNIEPKQYTSILIGNSADPSNEHSEIFEYLEPYKDKKIRIFTPLTNGDNDYAEKTIAEGRRIFGENFKPITTPIPQKEYTTFLSTIDIAIFNHKRHQAMGTIITLLAFGTKVYIRKDLASWEMLQKLGVQIFDTNALPHQEILDTTSCLEQNKQIIREYFSYRKLISQWHAIFND